MPRKKREPDPDRPVPLNFNQDDKEGEQLKPSGGRRDLRGDDEGAQYYAEEETLSPEELRKRRREGNL